MDGGVFYRPFFHLGDSRRHSHHHPWSNQLAVVNLLDEVSQHRLSDLEIGNDPVLHWADGHDVAWCPAQHALRLVTHSQHGGHASLNRDNRGFTQHNAPVSNKNEGVGRAKIDSNIVGKQALKIA